METKNEYNLVNSYIRLLFKVPLIKLRQVITKWKEKTQFPGPELIIQQHNMVIYTTSTKLIDVGIGAVGGLETLYCKYSVYYRGILIYESK